MTIGTDTHHWRSPLLGEPKHLDLPCGRVDYFERGSGTTLLFVHGWLANANLWRNVIGDLASDFRCIAIDMPLGAHRTALRPDADLTPAGCATIIRGAIRALGLDRPTLVGNDSGGAYSQMVAAAEPDRIGGLILNACETPFDAFPPPPFDGLPAVATDPTQLGTLFQALRDPELRISDAAFGLLIKHPLDADVSDSYALPCVTNPGGTARHRQGDRRNYPGRPPRRRTKTHRNPPGAGPVRLEPRGQGVPACARAALRRSARRRFLRCDRGLIRVHARRPAGSTRTGNPHVPRAPQGMIA
jgi:pimeloyl-ACP methyl ester carboxylesterase